jgi:hypothetical protein
MSRVLRSNTDVIKPKISRNLTLIKMGASPSTSPTFSPTSSNVYQIGLKFYNDSSCSTLLTASYALNGACSTIKTCSSVSICYDQHYSFQCSASGVAGTMWNVTSSFCSANSSTPYTLSAGNLTGLTGKCRSITASTNLYYFTTE